MKLYFLIISILILFFPTSFVAQKLTSQYIDSILDQVSLQTESITDRYKSVQTYFDLLKKAESIEYNKGTVQILIDLANILNVSGEFEKSSEYLAKASNYKKTLEANPYLAFQLANIKVYNNYGLGLPLMQKAAYKEAEVAINNVQDPFLKKKGLIILYKDYFNLSDNTDSLLYYFTKALNILEEPQFSYKFKNEAGGVDYYSNKIILNGFIGTEYLYQKNEKEALKHFETALLLIKSSNLHDYEGDICSRLGDLYEKKSEFKTALEYRLKAIEWFSQSGRMEYLNDEYELLGKLYAKMGNKEKELEYVAMNKQLTENLNNKKAAGRDITILNLISENEKALKSTKGQNRNVILSLIIMALFIAGIAFYKYNRYKKKKEQLLLQKEKQLEEKDKVINITEEVLAEKEQIITETEHILAHKEQEVAALAKQVELTSIKMEEKAKEVKILEQKTADAFEEIISLAKDNHPNFYARFCEVYPEFHGNLIEKHPDIQPTELILCAYVYLGFSNKEIAAYTFKSLKTIENRKTSLRKRLHIPLSEQLLQYLMKIKG